MEIHFLNRSNFDEILSLVPSQYHHQFYQEQAIQERCLYSQYQRLVKTILTLNEEKNLMVIPQEKDHILSWVGSTDISKKKYDIHQSIIKQLVPWRKGPYDYFSNQINSEWDSSIKWHRLQKYCEYPGGNVADIGCNNGYFMFRLLASPQPPKLIVGFEPILRNALQYLFLQQHTAISLRTQLIFLLLGYQALVYFSGSFDLVLCLGILYHHPNPFHILTLIKNSLKPGGQVLIDCQGIIGEQSLVLFPETQYAGKRNFWFLPTQSTLSHWLKRTGFKDIVLLGSHPIQKNEQRTSVHAPGSSLEDGIKEVKNYYREEVENSQTIEGYPSPIRLYMSARK